MATAISTAPDASTLRSYTWPPEKSKHFVATTAVKAEDEIA